VVLADEDLTVSDDEKIRLPQPSHIPVTWKGRDGALEGQAQVVAPTENDMRMYSDQRRLTCASCVKFAHRDGQLRMHEQKFIAKLVLEYQWKVHHLGAGPETFGLCRETNDRITSTYSPACEHYRARNGRLGRLGGDW
jgi:hypothetical protein